MTADTLLWWGFMGTGKSTVGRSVAEKARVRFVDLDAVIEEKHGRISAIFSDRSEQTFREIERTELRSLLAADGRRVVALGGGALIDDALREQALKCAFVVTLCASVDTIVERTVGSARPLLLVDDPRARVTALLAERATAYASTHAQIDTDRCTPGVVADAVLLRWSPSQR